MRIFQPDMEKLKRLTHYICACADRCLLGAIKLNKILWYSDIIAYRELGKPITGETYIKQNFGPVPKHIKEVLGVLVLEKKVIERDVPRYSYIKREYVSLTDPDISPFSNEEIEIVNFVTENICENFTAPEISEYSHNDLWHFAEMGEELPYPATLVGSFVEPSNEDMEWAKSVINDLKEEAVA